MILSPRRIVSRFRPRALRGLPPFFLPFRNKRGKRMPIIPIGRMPKIYGRIGNLEVRLARSRGDLRRAQKLRYEVFYEEMDAIPNASAMISRRDEDPYDEICEHLLVVDHGDLVATGKQPWRKRPRVVGTYRVLRQDMAQANGGFYSQGEYDINPLLAAKSRDYEFVEMGRSCVLKAYRNRRTVELLWHGIWTYVREQGADVMIGCASFPGVDPKRHAMALSFLHHNSLAPKEWRVKAHDRLYVNMNMMPAKDIDPKLALKGMPPLIKGYLRLGAYIGDGAVIDRQFGTTDVLIILPVEAITARYLGHFGAADETESELQRASRKKLS
ncbi:MULTISPECIES: GNAT family N-acyltransferase [Rhodomicrobium]|uniref:GNAT family N-acetyltransferase n=1 Tax=Rhodomicrobium TaxID=1068 RepID=UPI000B4B8483|nr:MULTISPECIES: GNAT family N-acyltransferase [Rhodomicrobium]